MKLEIIRTWGQNNEVRKEIMSWERKKKPGNIKERQDKGCREACMRYKRWEHGRKCGGKEGNFVIKGLGATQGGGKGERRLGNK